MQYSNLRKIKRSLFSSREVAQELGLTAGSARVLCHRYAKKGLLIRVRPDLYLLEERWGAFNQEEKFRLANLLQVPSYISFSTALAYWEITTQMQQNYCESAAQQRTKEIVIAKNHFAYFKLKKSLYFGFNKVGSFFIAEPEKAFLDALHLTSLGHYSIDWDALDMKKLDTKKIERWIKRYPKQTLNLWKRQCKNWRGTKFLK